MDLTPTLVGIGTLLLSIVAAMFKQELANLYQAWSIYHSRPFDQDRKPDTPDHCQLYNLSTGGWEDILIEKYQFSINQDERGVFICHQVTDGEATRLSRERIPFEKWAKMRKRTMPQTD